MYIHKIVLTKNAKGSIKAQVENPKEFTFTWRILFTTFSVWKLKKHEHKCEVAVSFFFFVYFLVSRDVPDFID